MSDVLDADLRFDCPRCGQAVNERLYGPCGACRAELVAAYGAAALDAGALDSAGLDPAAEGGAAEDGAAEGGAAGGGAPAAPAAGRFEPGMHVVPNHVATKD